MKILPVSCIALLMMLLVAPVGAQVQDEESCFDYYKFGSTTFSFQDGGQPRNPIRAGETLSITGAIHNPNDYPLIDGAVIATVRREDSSVSADNWHPVIETVRLNRLFDIPAEGSTPFTFTWGVPQKAPAGAYQVEFFYLAGGKYVFAGLPYVENFAGGRYFFNVEQKGESSVAHILRNTVKLNGQEFQLRHIPPTLQPGNPVTIQVGVAAQGSNAIPVTISKALFAWAESDGIDPILKEQQEVTLIPGQQIPITFIWQDAKPGAWELVIEVTPQDSTILPSNIRVRFPVEGNVPRIIYSGLGGYDGEDAIITTCATNATYGEGVGTVSTQLISNGEAFEPFTVENDGVFGSSIIARVPREFIDNANVEIHTTAKDEVGAITDQHVFTYTAAKLPGTQLVAAQEEGKQLPEDSSNPFALILIIVGSVLAVTAGVAFLHHRAT